MASTPTPSLLVKLPVSSPNMLPAAVNTVVPPSDPLSGLLAADSTLGARNPIFSNRSIDRTVRNVEEFLRFACRRTNEEMVAEITAADPQTTCNAIKLRLILCNGLDVIAKDRDIARDTVKNAVDGTKAANGAVKRRWDVQKQKMKRKAVDIEPAEGAESISFKKPRIEVISEAEPRKNIVKRKAGATPAEQRAKMFESPKTPKKRRVSTSPKDILKQKQKRKAEREMAAEMGSPKGRISAIPEGCLSFTVEEDAACILMALHREAMEVLKNST